MTTNHTNIQRGAVLTSKPCASVEIEIAPQYEEVCKRYLEQHACQMIPTRPGWFLVVFPQGTYEEERFGMSGLYTHQKYIVLQDGIEFTLITASAINETQWTRVSMSFPQEIFPE